MSLLTIASALAVTATTLTPAEARAATPKPPLIREDIALTRLYATPVSIAAGETVTYSTTNLSAGADTVLHLWDPLIDTEMAFNDDVGGGPGSQVGFTNNGPVSRTLLLVVRPLNPQTTGTARLMRNGKVMEDTVPVGGGGVLVRTGIGWVHETVQATGGATNTLMLGLASDKHMVAFDAAGAVGNHGRVSHDDIAAVMMGTITGTGTVDVISNDATDGDGDGLGELLENELGTCDDNVSAGCTNVFDLSDSDRDGLPDAAEVFGIDDPAVPQFMRAWGADPAHKDVFIELDYGDDFNANPFREEDLLTVVDIYAQGSADDLVNPDGLGGVRLHFDVGLTPNDPDLATAYGDWGGTEAIPADTGHSMAKDLYRDPVREGIFHYGIMDQGSGGGVATRWGQSFGWKATTGDNRPRAIAHELGHNLGLGHWGHDSWGMVNGKPNYFSLMNYAYTVDELSQGESTTVLDPSFVSEVDGVGGDASHLTVSPYSRAVAPGDDLGDPDKVDWDYDGVFTEGGVDAIRAPVTFCDRTAAAMSQNERDLHIDADLPGTTPALVRGPGNRLYAFFIEDGRIRYYSALVNGSASEGSCPGGDTIGANCTTWNAVPFEVPTAADAKSVSAAFIDQQVLLAFQGASDGLRTIRATGQSNGALTGWAGEAYHQVSVAAEPAVLPMRVDSATFGSDTVVALFYRGTSDNYRWRTMASVTSTSSTSRGKLKDGNNDVISGIQSPTFVNWPYDPFASDQGTACGALVDASDAVGLYCYDRATNRFVQQSLTGAPTSKAKPGLAFHAYRDASGSPRSGDSTRGNLWLTVTGDGDYDGVTTWISTPISDADPNEALSTVDFLPEQLGHPGPTKTNMRDGAGLALYDDEQLGAMKGLWIREKGKDGDDPEVALRFLPLADATFGATLTDGNDFQALEKGICWSLKSSNACGPSSFGLDPVP